METSDGILARLGEKTLGWIILGILVLLGYAIYRMPGETKAYIWSCVWRSVVWTLIVAAVPWSARLVIRRVAAVGSNWAGVGLLAALTAVDLIAAAILMTGWPAGFWPWAAALGALAAAVTYNYLVTEYLADTAGL